MEKKVYFRMYTILFVINAACYGNENALNALRLARTLLDEPEITIQVFLLGDAVVCAKKGQKTPDGYYNLGKMLQSLIHKKVDVGICGTCIDARGIEETELIDGVHKGTMKELASWVRTSEKILTF
ncbi:MAG: DsrE family protein [Candidatus Thermoplasmatota archaeon]|nr:DsrE family protein [Candidatus Thermoplasmatota archaeon]